jgi:hypothetical protein
MSTCLPNLTHPFLTFCKIITFKVDQKNNFPYALGRQQSFEGQKNHFLKWIWNVPLHILVSKWVSYMSTKSHINKRCGTLRKKLFSSRGYAEIYIHRAFLTIKKIYKKLFYWKSRRWAHILVPWLYIIFFCFEKNWKSQILVAFQSSWS